MRDCSKLRPYGHDKQKSFEELCYQLAMVLYGDRSRFTPIDDCGGGDGVEFHLRWPNGSEWGWQAKFYFPDQRLARSSRKPEIVKSLQRSLAQHPHLKKWILCTPTNFTPGEQKWFEETLAKKIPPGRSVELEHWGDSRLEAWFAEPRLAGRRLHFFGELELTMEWFRDHFAKLSAGVADKYLPELHTETHVDQQWRHLDRAYRRGAPS